MAGCSEYVSLLLAALKDARNKRRSLSIIWLILTKAYGSISQMLILFALRRYKIPEDWITMVIKHDDGLWARKSARGVASDWYQYEKGIFSGCTISVILFIPAFKVILEYVSQAGLPRYSLSTRKSVPVLCAFMDDVSLMTTSTPASKIVLQRTVIAQKWAKRSPRNQGA